MPDNQTYVQKMVEGQEILIVCDPTLLLLAMVSGAMLTLVIIGIIKWQWKW